MFKGLTRKRMPGERPWKMPIPPIRFMKSQNHEMLLRFKAGDNEAFAEIYKKFQGPVYRYLLRMVRDTDCAEELTQDVFMKVFKYREQYELQFEFSTWLWTIAKNTALDRMKRGRIESDPLEPEQMASGDPDAERRLMQIAEKARLIELMKSLNEKQRQALMLRMIHKLSYHEIARILGMSLSGVKTLIHRGKDTVKRTFHRQKKAGETPVLGHGPSELHEPRID